MDHVEWLKKSEETYDSFSVWIQNIHKKSLSEINEKISTHENMTHIYHTLFNDAVDIKTDTGDQISKYFLFSICEIQLRMLFQLYSTKLEKELEKFSGKKKKEKN